VKIDWNLFDLKFEQWNPQPVDFVDKPIEWTVNLVEHVWMNLNRFDES
jgi:hypothetical protein